jgi:CheY-like chemotaxis protein
VRFVSDGQQLLDYLRQADGHAGAGSRPYPDLILLDLNMPKRDGYSALREIKGDPDLKLIPVVIFSTTQEDEAVARSYDLGANSFIPKPMSFDGLTKVVKSLGGYWCKVASLLPQEAA